MRDAPILTLELLEQLEARWQAQGAPIVKRLQPGISEAEMTEIVTPLELRVPSEARTWYAWHNGAVGSGMAVELMMTGLGWKFFPLQRAVEETIEQRQRAREIGGEDAERWLWRWAWLPLADNRHGGLIIVDGRSTPDAPRTPVYYTEPEVGTQYATSPRAASLGQMVGWWIEAMDAHLIGYDAAAGRWRYEYDSIDPSLERTWLV